MKEVSPMERKITHIAKRLAYFLRTPLIDAAQRKLRRQRWRLYTHKVPDLRHTNASIWAIMRSLRNR